MPQKMFNQFLCSSLMLPEHREALQRRAAQLRQQEKMCRPCIDAQQHELWERLISEALRQKSELSVSFLDAREGIRVFKGMLHSVDGPRREIIMQGKESTYRIPLDSITGVRLEI